MVLFKLYESEYNQRKLTNADIDMLQNISRP